MDSRLNPLPRWWEQMLSSPVRMVLFLLLTIICSPLLLLFGAVVPLFRKVL